MRIRLVCLAASMERQRGLLGMPSRAIKRTVECATFLERVRGLGLSHRLL